MGEVVSILPRIGTLPVTKTRHQVATRGTLIIGGIRHCLIAVPSGGSWGFPLKRLGAFASIPNGFSGIPIPLTAPKFNSSPLKSYRTQKEIVFQASFFRGYVKLWCFFVLLKGCEVEKLVSVDDNKFHYGRLIGTRDFQRFLMTSS